MTQTFVADASKIVQENTSRSWSQLSPLWLDSAGGKEITSRLIRQLETTPYSVQACDGFGVCESSCYRR
ncbi:hypothetical protein Y1Q_0020588 [Alligator mississippiensis]|uniref:Uncharacterized protein n=1 Tax=Alligator mississippiensis TaxID=8496 RepID=A0A151PIZ8_ALLMI|nr:hypothetical protein Y1Q_0020588 [Alligator mississippiensis]